MSGTQTDLSTDSVTDSDAPAEEMEEEEYEPPCREAERYIVPCPICQRRMKIKTLKYSHICKRSFDPIQRALEQHKAASQAIRARMAQLAARPATQKMGRD